MSESDLHQFDGLLYTLDLSAINGLPDFAVMFVLADTTSIPPSIPVEETWTKYFGLYLFLDQEITTKSQATLIMNTLIAQNKSNSVGFIWITNAASQSPILSNFIPLKSELTSERCIVETLSTITFRNFTLGINKGTVVTFDPTNYVVSFNNTSLQAPTLFFATDRGERFGRIGPSVNSAASHDLTNSFVQLSLATDLTIGCWKFQLTLEKNPLPNLLGDIDKLDISCRFFVDDPSSAGKLLSYRYPILSTEENPISFVANLDPFYLLNTKRSFFALTDPGTVMNHAPPPTDTYYRDSFGQVITITPVDTNAIFVFSVNQQYKIASLTDPLYLVPQGGFNIGIQLPSNTQALRFLCGFSGVEYLGSSTLKGSQIYFLSGSDAYYSPSFKIPPSSQVFSDLVTTAWVCIVPASQDILQYYVQSSHAIFYTMGTSANFMNYCEIPLGTLNLHVPPLNSMYMPLVSYAGVDEDKNPALDYQDFEHRVLSCARRAIVEANFGASHSSLSMPVTAVTSQGMLATFSGSGLSNWNSLTLAVDSTGNALQLLNITQPLRLALLANQVFIVANNQKEFSNLCTVVEANMQLDVAGWTFLLSTVTWEEGTIMILKLHDYSLESLIEDASLWNLPAVANVSTTQKALQSIIDIAKKDVKKHGSSSFYADFVEIIEDPLWNGVLFLNSPISFTTFPSEFSMLMPGIDQNKMVGHHIGVNLTPVINKSGVISLETSSMFGLVAYQDSEASLTPDVDYEYKVTSLFVLLKNSQIERFEGKLILQINELFGYPVTSTVPSNILHLHGSAQSHNGHIKCSFICTNEVEFSLPKMASAVSSVVIDQVVFTPYNKSSTHNMVTAIFDMQGTIQFNPIGSFDIFSLEWGGYNHLYLNLQFYFSSPKNYSLTFDASHITINSTESKVRTSSFADQFPMAVTQIISNASTTSTLLQYIPISIIPSTWSSLLNEKWYGLTFNLSLGSLGSLAGKKSFSAEVLIVWSPPQEIPTDPTNLLDSIWVGIKLPGFCHGNNAINFEGVLKLGLEAVWLEQQAGAYILVFKDFALHLLSYALPNSGAVDLQLFGDAGTKASSLAWYGTYVQGNKN